jgi:hypothetical protein
VHQHADEQTDGELYEGLVVGAELIDERGSGDGLEDVVRRHRQERVGEQQERHGGFVLA